LSHQRIGGMDSDTLADLSALQTLNLNHNDLLAIDFSQLKYATVDCVVYCIFLIFS
jgi:hypothetical protein